MFVNRKIVTMGLRSVIISLVFDDIEISVSCAYIATLFLKHHVVDKLMHF